MSRTPICLRKILCIPCYCVNFDTFTFVSIIFFRHDHSLPTDTLKNFSHSCIALLFLFEFEACTNESNGLDTWNLPDVPSATTASGQHSSEKGSVVSSVLEYETSIACKQACERILLEVLAAGFTTVTISCSLWTEKMADPMVSCTTLSSLIII